MIKIYNTSLLNNYVEKYNLNSFLNDNLLNLLELHSFSKNEFICTLNDELLYMHFLVKGKAKVTTLLSTGKSLLLCFNTPLSIMGDLELIDNSFADCNVQALEECLCISLPLTLVKEFGYNDPIFLRFIISSLEKKLRSNSNYMSINLLLPLENRVASYLISALPTGSSSVDIHGINNLSELLGTSYRHLSRVIKNLSDENIIKKNRNTIEILNLEKLNSLCSDTFKRY